MRQLNILFILGSIIIFSNCGKDINDEEFFLTGDWNAYITMWTGDTVATEKIYIQQNINAIDFYQDEQIISSGLINNDTIKCSEFYGVTEIYVDNYNHMHSELPLAEIAGPILFEKLK
ncbi:hypothetical protein ES705_49531 [subsurface metagenome]